MIHLPRRMSKFQYQPLHEGLPSSAVCAACNAISIPAPPRGASVMGSKRWAAYKFQYQPLHEGLRCLRSACHGLSQFQYQPLHEGLPDAVAVADASTISIPAPPRGASHGQMISQVSLISIPAPPRGASPGCCLQSHCDDFNTSPSTRGFSVNINVVLNNVISIPAPPRGASPPLWR